MKAKDVGRRCLFIPIICLGIFLLVLLYQLILTTGFFDISFDWVDSRFIRTKQNACLVSNSKHPYIADVKSEGSGTVDINNASAEELDTLPRVGKKTADAIIEQRRAMGGFSCINDLVCTPGIGIKTLNEIKPYIRISQYKGKN